MKSGIADLIPTVLSYHFCRQDKAYHQFKNLKYFINMNGIKINVYGKVFKEICDNYDGAEHFTYERIEEIFSHEKLCVEEVIYF